MYKKNLKVLSLVLTMLLTVSVFASCKNDGVTVSSTPADSSIQSDSSSVPSNLTTGEKISFSVYYPDNATLPFREDWLTVTTIEEKYNVDIKWEPIPIADFDTKVSLALNSGTVPDVFLYGRTEGENASLALNGAILPISDYPELTPNFNAKVEELGLQEDVEKLYLKDGKRYYMPTLYDKPFYDGGLILREDFLTEKGLADPKTYDDLYNILKAYKEENPESYPLTILASPRVLYRMTMPSFGVSLGMNGSGGSKVLSWNYSENKYFAGAISEEYREYMRFLSKLFKEGLLDPEMAEPIDGDKWAQKLATGSSMATYAYYDQIGGVESSSTIDGFNLQLYPPLEGPAGAHHQQKNRTHYGVMFPSQVTKRTDFEQLVKVVDEIFFSTEGSDIWCLGVEGVTYNKNGDEIVYTDEIKNSSDGIYKYMQLKYGCGIDPAQMIWINSREMTKYDENYSSINQVVAAMPDSIQYIPPTPMFDDLTAEEASSIQTPLFDKFQIWADGFITGTKDIEADWDTYVSEMNDLQIEKFLGYYNDNLK